MQLCLYPFCPKSHVPVGVRRFSNGEITGTVPGSNRSSHSYGQPKEWGHLEATTVRAFLVSFNCPKVEITEEAHLIAFRADAVFVFPIKRQTKRSNALARCSIAASFAEFFPAPPITG